MPETKTVIPGGLFFGLSNVLADTFAAIFLKNPFFLLFCGIESCIWAYGSLMVSKSKSPPIAVHECCVFLWDDPAAVGRRLRK
jgi:hypothetical protein